MATVTYRKIILRRGLTADLPGGPSYLYREEFLGTGDEDQFLFGINEDNEYLIIETYSRFINFAAPLDEGEMAFGEDQGRIFIGVDPTKDLKHKDRLVFPFQNVEVIGANSTEAFAGMHGEQMREGTQADYSVSSLEPTPNWKNANNVLIDNTDVVNAFIKYSITTANGIPIRYGNHEIQYRIGDLNVEMIDDAEHLRRLSDYDPQSAMSEIQFRYVINGAKIALQYKNLTGLVLIFRWNISRPY